MPDAAEPVVVVDIPWFLNLMAVLHITPDTMAEQQLPCLSPATPVWKDRDIYKLMLADQDIGKVSFHTHSAVSMLFTML